MLVAKRIASVASRRTLSDSVLRLTVIVFITNCFLYILKPRRLGVRLITSLSSTSTTTVRGCLIHWYGPLNYKALEGWVKYHRVRWGLTDVDIYLPDRRLDEARVTFGGIYEGVHVHIFSNTLTEEEARDSKQLMLARQIWIFNQALKNARKANNDFFINFDADEFLISDDFTTLSDMFAYAKHFAVSLPIFSNNYHICSNNSLEFGSTTFQSLVPHGANFIDDPRLEYYDEPPRSCVGNAKYIVMPMASSGILESPHDPLGCAEYNDTKNPPFSETTYYMSGRTIDGEHVRVTHMRTELGIFADLNMSACTKASTCKYVNWAGDCVEGVQDAIFENKPSALNSILAKFPLFSNSSEIMTNALCYAKRYPDLMKGFCDGYPNQCLYGALWKHFVDHGKAQNMLWSCRV